MQYLVRYINVLIIWYYVYLVDIINIQYYMTRCVVIRKFLYVSIVSIKLDKGTPFGFL